jgi:glucan 1,3-beta-glucosidase
LLTDAAIFALNWAVSQATSLIYTNFILAPDSNHIGVEMDGGEGGGGSGTAMGDLTFSGGQVRSNPRENVTDYDVR